jgi:hypothetical protein
MKGKLCPCSNIFDPWLLGPDTTALLFAEELRKTEKCLTVITNGVLEAVALSQNDNIRVVLAPGEVDRLEGFAWGHETTDFISKFKSGMAFFCANGLAASGVSEAHSRTVWTVRTMIERSTQQKIKGSIKGSVLFYSIRLILYAESVCQDQQESVLCSVSAFLLRSNFSR